MYTMKNTAQVLVRLPKELREEIEGKAKSLGIGVSTYIRMELTKLMK